MIRKRLIKIKPSLANQFFYLAALTLFFILLISIYITWSNYNYYLQEKNNRFDKQVHNIENALLESFEYITNLANFIGKKIVSNKDKSPQNIAFLISQPTKRLKDNIFTWTLFDFVNPNGYVIVDSTTGVLSIPKKVDNEKRAWIYSARQEPWILQFSQPDIGIISGELILPTGFGLTDDKNNFIGYLTAGININKLTNKLKEVTDDKISFILMTKGHKLISSSENYDSSEFNNFVEHGFLKIKDTNFTKKHTVNKYPFVIFIGENKKESYQAFYQLILPQVLRNLVMGIIFAAILLFLRIVIVKPIYELSEYAEKIAKDEEIFIGINHYKYKEFIALAEQLREIYKIKYRLKQINEILERDLKKTSEDLKQALSIKTEFLRNINHEVRTPVQGVIGIATGLVDSWNKLNDDQKFKYTQEISQAADRLFSLVNNILDLSQFNTGKFKLALTEFNIVELINEVIDEFNVFLSKDNLVRINFIPYTSNSVIEGDSKKIMQVVRNLISNSIKFCNTGEIKITLECLTNQNQILFTIKDEGIGIPEGEREEIFKPFYQSSLTKTEAGGTGLGLAISKEIIETHNGKIWVEETEGKGALFKFVIPINHYSTFDNKEIKHTKNNPITILIVDDEELCVSSLQMILANENFKLLTAMCGKEALEYINDPTNNIDIVLLDMMMPDMNGIEVIKKIKSTPVFDYVNIILQTGMNDKDKINEAFKLGAKGCLNKPYKKEEIITLIKNIISEKNIN
ncbi:MAG: response regulator [Sphingobacteriia bacterium]|nr:response regulator [Sphingobacteriia bacterium]